MSRRLRLFPLNAVLFPGAVLNLHVFEPRYKQMILECIESGEGFGVTLIAEGAEAGDPNVVPHEIGSVAEIVDVTALPFGRYFISTIGRERFRIQEILSRDPFFIVDAEMIEEDMGGEADAQIERLLPEVRGLFEEYLEMLVEFSGYTADVELPGDAAGASYLIGDMLQVADAVKQRLLELSGTRARLEAEREFLQRVIPQLGRLLERRRRELEERGDSGGEDQAYRADQERYFGKFFSAN
ncbi:MAG TPA: LON peptidase substrate-binding domain-containing protein [Candidatus Baltobacteraceae bacterium]|jgi:Lon protease-like protein|nr:LON peptidase substrate-binding domain-containing protein [Candidatus Baltobacteraceae bacterium]